MEWCLDCHRQPEKLPAAAARGLQRGLRAARRPARAGAAPREGVRHPDPHQLLHVPPMSAGPRHAAVDLAGVRRRLDGVAGRRYWKSLEELAETPEFLEFLHREFPEQASTFDDPKGRRQFLTLMGASLALAGLTACTRQPDEKIVPYVKPPEDVVPGRPLFFATALARRRLREGRPRREPQGRPTKVEGNPDHPASLGRHRRLRARPQSSASTTPTARRRSRYLGEIRPWGAVPGGAAARRSAAQRRGRARACASSPETVTSPTLAAQLAGASSRSCPRRAGTSGSPSASDNAARGRAARLRASRWRRATDFDEADVVLSPRRRLRGQRPREPAPRPRVRDAAARSRASSAEMNRLYVVESTPSLTGAVADHRLPLRSSRDRGLRARARGGPGPRRGAAGRSDARGLGRRRS